LGILSQNEKRDKKHPPLIGDFVSKRKTRQKAPTADWGFCLKMKNETKSAAPLIGDFVSKRKTRQKAPHR